jgi:benzoyl-CoA reductase/2-hydroxyglutaryl-CoA dehydratase subunit BcrC/BadD/HgdB
MEKKQKGMWPLVEKYYQDYGSRARELKKDGKKFMGYICSFVPVEIIQAAGFIPFRIRGNVHEPITKGNTQLETIACPFMRSCFDLSIKGHYDFCEGVIIPHACDSMTRSYSVWKYSLGLPYSHFVNVPHTVNAASLEFFEAELNTFRKSLGRYAGKEISAAEITQAITAYNQLRKKVKALYELRKTNPPLVSGTEMAKLLTVTAGLPVEEASVLCDQALDELHRRTAPSGQKLPRILIDGACIDNIDLVQLVEQSGASVVADDLCLGMRDHWPNTDVDQDPLKALSRRYLEKLNCPRTFRQSPGGSLSDDLQARFGDMGAHIKEFRVDGIILYVYKYCDPFGFEVSARKAYLGSLGVPILYLEDEYSAGTLGRLRTRIQAFLEMMG